MQSSRHDIGDEDWGRIDHLLPGRPGLHGGVVWRDLPFCFGNFNSVWQGYNRWCEAGVWEQIVEVLTDEDQE